MKAESNLIAIALMTVFTGCLHRPLAVPQPTDTAQLDIFRSHPNAAKIYVQAFMSDGAPALFMVDTGAGVTAISQELADRLGVQATVTAGTLQGLSGEVPFVAGSLTTLSLGGVEFSDVEVAVGVPGIPSHAGWMKIDGILGNNVWGELTLVIDYPEDRITIGRPGTIALPDSAVPFTYNGNHLIVEAVLNVGDDSDTEQYPIEIELDTGARQIILSGSTGNGMERFATTGDEPIYGIGASEAVPASAFYRTTRRVPVTSVELAGTNVDQPGFATWVNYEPHGRFGPTDMRGLLGHSVVSEHTLYLDYPNEQFAMVLPTGEGRQLNGHQLLLDQELQVHGSTSNRGLYRAQLLLGVGDSDAALDSLDNYLRKNDNPEAIALRSRLLRFNGDLDEAAEVISTLSPQALVEQGEIVGAINLHVLNDSMDSAAALANAATVTSPDSSVTHVAASDIAYHMGDFNGAREALLRASQLTQNPDAELMRRSRIAMAEGDNLGSASYLRRRLSLYPSDGFALWAYSVTVTDSQIDTFRMDMSQALGRLHPGMLPLDFMTAVYREIGENDLSHATMLEGIARDCDDIPIEPELKNCMAWYSSMGDGDLEQALEDVDSALTDDPHRSDFLDTKAVVHLRRGELEQAQQASRNAALLAPDSIYNLWQLSRIEQLMETGEEQ
jgi:tetratricopeptide (TPR) repeat protein